MVEGDGIGTNRTFLRTDSEDIIAGQAIRLAFGYVLIGTSLVIGNNRQGGSRSTYIIGIGKRLLVEAGQLFAVNINHIEVVGFIL